MSTRRPRRPSGPPFVRVAAPSGTESGLVPAEGAGAGGGGEGGGGGAGGGAARGDAGAEGGAGVGAGEDAEAGGGGPRGAATGGRGAAGAAAGIGAPTSAGSLPIGSPANHVVLYLTTGKRITYHTVSKYTSGRRLSWDWSHRILSAEVVAAACYHDISL